MKHLTRLILAILPLSACSYPLENKGDISENGSGYEKQVTAFGTAGESRHASDRSEERGAPFELPLATWADFSYAGGFRLPNAVQRIGGTDFKYRGNRGSVAIALDRTKMFVGAYRSKDDNGKPGWAQVAIPAIDPQDDFANMPIAVSVQGLADVWNNISRPDGSKNRSMHCVEYDGMLIGTMIHNYDASMSQTYFLWRVEDSANLSSAKIGGLYELEGQYHAAGWIVEVPDEWKPLVGHNHVMGNAHNYSIAGRASIGPTFFGVDLSQVTRSTPSKPIKTAEYMNFPRDQEKALFIAKYPEHINERDDNWHSSNDVTYTDMHYNLMITPHPTEFPPSHADFPDQDSHILGNDIWTVTTRAGIGFIIPGTRTYAVFGKAAGMEHGLGYRIKNDIGREMSGPAPYVNSDRYNFHWFFDMRDIVDSKNGLKDPWDIVPYSYGRIKLPFERQPTGNQVEDAGYIFGGTFDPDNMRVYFAIRGYDKNKPLILAYDIKL